MTEIGIVWQQVSLRGSAIKMESPPYNSSRGLCMPASIHLKLRNTGMILYPRVQSRLPEASLRSSAPLGPWLVLLWLQYSVMLKPAY